MIHDLIEAARRLVRRPGFAALVVLPLALGIAAVATVFSAVYGVLLRPPPYAEPDRLVQVWERRPRLPTPDEVAAFSTDHFREWRDANTVFDGMAMYGDFPFAYQGLADAPTEPRPLSVERVSATLFDVLGVSPILGRGFRPEEGTPGLDAVAVLGHAFWTREFGADPGMIGRSLRFDDRSFEVIGVAPPDFGFPIPTTEVYVPYAEEPPPDLSTGQIRLELVQVVARLAEGVTREQAEAEAGALIARLSEASEIQAMLNDGVSVHLTPFTERATRRVRGPLTALFGVTLFVLLIACGNVANLLLTRAAWRERELAVRSALGAGRGQLARGLLAESLVLAAAAGGVALLLSLEGVELVRALSALGLPELESARVDWRVGLFTLAAAAVAALVAGAAPALRASSRDPARALGASGRSDAAALGGAGRRFAQRGLFASAQLALCLPLLVGAGLFTRSFLALAAAPPGYQPENAVTFEAQFPEGSTSGPEAQTARLDRLRESLSGMPGVTAVGHVDTLPLSSERAVIGFQRLGEDAITDPNAVPRALLRRISPGAFRAMGIPLIEGRGFEEADRTGPPVSVVNQALVDRYFRDPPIGLELRGMGRIVGVVGNTHEEGPDTPVEPILYFLQGSGFGSASLPLQRVHFVLRHAPGAEVAAAAVARVRELDPEVRTLNIQTLEDRIRESVARPRLYALLLGGFAAAAALLALWGVLGVVGFQTTARLPAHGVRMAFGATPARIRRLVLRDGLTIAAVGLAPGLLFAWLLSRLLGSELSPVLFEVAPLDPLVLALSTGGLAAAAVVAALGPARRAARLDVVSALRVEAH